MSSLDRTSTMPSSDAIARLERSVRRLHALLLLSSLIGLAGFTLPRDDVVETREVRIVDDVGRVRARLGLSEEGTGRLALLDERGVERAVLAAETVHALTGTRESGARLVLRDRAGQRRVELSTEDEEQHGDPQRLAFFFPEKDDHPEVAYMELGTKNRFVTHVCELSMTDYWGRPMIGLGPSSYGAAPYLSLSHPAVPEDDRLARVVGAQPASSIFIGFGESLAHPALDMVTAERRLSLEVDPTDGPRLRLMDEGEERTLALEPK